MPFADLHHYLAPLSYSQIDTATYQAPQYGAYFTQDTRPLEARLADAQIVLLGCGEYRANDANALYSDAPDKVREQLYTLYNWHPTLKIADAGNIVQGASPKDTYAALNIVLQALHSQGKLVVIIGGGHELTLCQYNAFKANGEIVDIAVFDMLIDLLQGEQLDSHNFLMELLTSTPSYIRNFSVLGFQSFASNPNMVETLGKLQFDCMRLGKLRNNIQEAEPYLRHSDIVSIDINCVKHSDAPANIIGSPNGLHGDEVCSITQFAGMSDKCATLGLYGYKPQHDVQQHTAKLLAQMVWYFIDGVHQRMHEAALHDKNEFWEYKVLLNEVFTSFVKSKRTNRWWVQLPKGNYYPCSYADYLTAADGHIPDVWLKEVNREVVLPNGNDVPKEG
jgi:formiminoglutamase